MTKLIEIIKLGLFFTTKLQNVLVNFQTLKLSNECKVLSSSYHHCLCLEYVVKIKLKPI